MTTIYFSIRINLPINNSMEDGIGEMIHLNTPITQPVNGTMYTLLSFHHLRIITRPFLFSRRSCIRGTNDCRNDQ
ncbi:hypothetical protein TNCV_2842281 [Trichonephila clavipes]|nr:hypothetical protein TNCV_2842281 [Trichonephila clavipes]